MFRIVIGLISAIAALIAIFQFFSGSVSLRDVMQRPEQLVTTIKVDSPEIRDEVITKVDLGKFTPVFRYPANADGSQEIWAIEPARPILWVFGRTKDALVKLTCSPGAVCSGRRIIPIRKDFGRVDTIAFGDNQMVVLTPTGRGMIYHFDRKTFTDFSFELPCLPRNSGTAAAPVYEYFAVERAAFQDSELALIVHAIQCSGVATLGANKVKIVQPPGALTTDSLAYELRVVMSFDSAGYISDGRIETLRSNSAASWLRTSSSADGPSTFAEVLQYSPGPLRDEALQRRSRILVALRAAQFDRLSVLPSISDVIALNTKVVTRIPRADLLAILDLTGARNGAWGVYFTPDGVHAKYMLGPTTFATYEALARTGGTIEGPWVKYGSFIVPAVNSDPALVKQAVDDAIYAATGLRQEAATVAPAPTTP